MNPLSPYLIWIKIGAAALAAIVIGWSAHWVTANYYELKIAETEKQHALAITIAQDRAARQQEDADEITRKSDVAAAEARQKIVHRTQTLIQKVPEYVTHETDVRFPLPCGFIRLHNAAASGVAASAVPLPAGKTDGDQCDVAASTAAGVIVGNYGLALSLKSEVAGWRSWYDQQKANWDAYRASVTKEK